MSKKYENVPDYVRLADTDVLCLALLRNLLNRLPPELLERTRFPSHEINKAIATRQLSRDGMLAAAYFGFMPIWSTYTKFQAHTHRINAYADHPDWEHFQKDVVARENSAAAEYGLSRGELKRLFKKLDEKAQLAGFDSFEDVFQADEHGNPIPLTALAAGPRYLQDIAKAIQSNNSANFIMKTIGTWVLMLYPEDENAFGMAWPISGLRIGGFRFNGYIDHVSMEWSWATDTPIFDAPKYVLNELRALAQLQFPDHEYVEREAPSALDAWQTWTMTHAAFFRNA